MKVLVVVRMVPDVAGELEVSPNGKRVDRGSSCMVPNESDVHALEQAMLLKSRCGCKVTVLALGAPDVDEFLSAALAEGADRAVKITGVPEGVSTRRAAEVFAQFIGGGLIGFAPADLILTGVQAVNDLDGLIAPLIACELGLPFLGIVVALSVEPGGKNAIATREFPRGVKGEFEVALPAVFGIGAAERPPRYVPVAKVRDAARTHRIECIPAPLPANLTNFAFDVLQYREPPSAGHAEMLSGSADDVCEQLCDVLEGRGLM